MEAASGAVREGRDRTGWALAAAALAGLSLWALFVHTDDTDAGLYRTVVRNLVADGNWFSLRYLPNVHPVFREHLPFGFWPFALVQRVTELGPPLLAWAASLATLGAVARRQPLAAVLLGTTPAFFTNAALVRLDDLLVPAATVAGLLLWDVGRPSWRRWAVALLAAAAGAAIKGPFALVPVVATALAYPGGVGGEAAVTPGAPLADQGAGGEAAVTPGAPLADQGVGGAAAVTPGAPLADQGVGGEAAVTPGAPLADQGAGGAAAVTPGAALADQGAGGATAVTPGAPLADQGAGGAAAVTPGAPLADQGAGGATAGTPGAPLAYRGVDGEATRTPGAALAYRGVDGEATRTPGAPLAYRGVDGEATRTPGALLAYRGVDGEATRTPGAALAYRGVRAATARTPAWMRLGGTGALCAVALAGPLAFLLWDRAHGGTWWTGYFQTQVLASASGARTDGSSFALYPFVAIAGRYWPWLPLVGWALWRARTSPALRRQGLAVLLMLVFLCLPARKVWNHALVVYPFLSLWLAEAVAPELRRWVPPRRSRALAIGFALVVPVAVMIAHRMSHCIVPEPARAFVREHPGERVAVVTPKSGTPWKPIAALADEFRASPWLAASLDEARASGAAAALSRDGCGGAPGTGHWELCPLRPP